MYHGAFDRFVSYIKLSNASRYSSYFLFCFRSCLDTLQLVVSSSRSVSSLFFCSCLSIWKKNFMTRYPLSARVLSNLLVLSTLFRYSLSDNSPDILPPTMSLIHPPSRNTNSPCSGILVKYLYRNGLRFSSSVEYFTDSTLKNLGSIFFMILPTRLPLPAAPQPSNMTNTGILPSFTLI